MYYHPAKLGKCERTAAPYDGYAAAVHSKPAAIEYTSSTRRSDCRPQFRLESDLGGVASTAGRRSHLGRAGETDSQTFRASDGSSVDLVAVQPARAGPTETGTVAVSAGDSTESATEFTYELAPLAAVGGVST